MSKIDIKGTIVSNDEKWIYDWFEIESVSPKDVSKALYEANGQDITVEINSGGGDVFAGNEIYYLLSQYKGNITTDIVGMAGSAASLPAMLGKSRIVPSGMLMIHNVSSGASGDYHAMDHQSEVLKVANSAISNSYRVKTGMSQKDLLSLMDHETWMDAEKAVRLGFIDEVINDTNKVIANKSHQNLYNSCFANVLSKEVIEKVRNQIKNPNSDNQKNTGSDFLIQKAQLNLLKLKGALNHE
jgi:ATP-dependent protease ClpP protease subunit